MNNEISLAIETSGRIGSIALACGPTILDEIFFSAPLRHGSETLTTIDNLFKKNNLKPSDLNTIYVSAGPGSFTGIRLAVTMAKTMSYALNTKIVSVPSLEAQALNAALALADGIAIENIGVILEAGRGKVFSAAYKYNPYKSDSKTFIPDFETISEPTMQFPQEFLDQLPNNTALIGEGLKYHEEEFSSSKVTILDEKYHQPKASYVFQCGRLRSEAGIFTDFDNFKPLYMRKPEAELNLENQIQA